METEKVLEIVEYVDGDLRSLRIFKSGCNRGMHRESEP